MLPRVHLVKGNDADFLLMANDQIISQHLYQHGTWEQSLLDIAKLFLHNIEQPWVLDIGANLGAFTIPIAKTIASQQGIVSCFEPQRIVYYQLCGNIFLNRLDNCYAYNCALGTENGNIDIAEMDFNQANNVGAYSLKQEYAQYDNVHYLEQTHSVQQLRLDNVPPPQMQIIITH